MISVCFINILLLFSLLLLFQFYSGVHYEHIPYKHMLNMYTETHCHTHKCLHVCTCKHHPSIRRSSVYEHRCWVCVLKIVLQTFVSELYKTNKKYKNIRVNHNTPNRTSFCLPCLSYCKHFSLSLSLNTLFVNLIASRKCPSSMYGVVYLIPAIILFFYTKNNPYHPSTPEETIRRWSLIVKLYNHTFSQAVNQPTHQAAGTHKVL